MKIPENLKNKLKSGKHKALKDERKLKSSRFNAGKVIVIVFWVLVAGVIFFSFQSYVRTGFLNNKVNGYQSEAKAQIESLQKTDYVTSPAAEDYGARFVREYINLPVDHKDREKRTETLTNYLAEGLKPERLENTAEFKGKRVLKDSQLHRITDIKNNKATLIYRIQYDIVHIKQETVKIPANKKDKNSKPQEKVVQKEQPTIRKELLIAVPIGTDGQSFNVIEQPYYKPLPAETKLSVVTDDSEKNEREYQKEPELKEFATDFFTSYTENTVNEMSYLMEKPESLQGVYSFKGIEEFTAYNIGKGEYDIKALVKFQEADSGVLTLKPVTMTVKKEKGKYFVKKLKHTIGG